jgi:NADH-quinone oxidoreductase subunit C
MKTIEEIFDILKNEFGEAVIELKTDVPFESFIIVNPLEVNKIALFLRDKEDLQFDNLMNLSSVDDANGLKNTLEDGSFLIVGGTLSVIYHLESIYLKHKIVIKTSTSRDEPKIESVAEIWRCADWHEREAYDMMGIIFLNHPDLTRILMPYDWDAGYPLRKDYKNPEFYQGMKVPY